MHRNIGHSDDAQFYKRGHDCRRNADYRRAPANDELRRNFRIDVLHALGSGSKRLPAQEGLLIIPKVSPKIKAKQ